MSYPRVTLSATPSYSRGTLIAKLNFFFQEARTKPTLSPHDFDAWFFGLTTEDRATVHNILEPMRQNWPSDVEFPNIIALVHWLRDHREGEKTQNIVELIEYLRIPDAGTTQPEPEQPVPEPTCPGGIDEEPQPQPIHPRPYPVDGKDVLAVLVMVLAPACLVRLLMILYLISVLRQASNGMRL